MSAARLSVAWGYAFAALATAGQGARAATPLSDPVPPPVVTVTTLEQLRDACDALTPPERKTFGGATTAERAARARAHAIRHAAWANAAVAFRFEAKDVKLLARDPALATLEVSARPALRGMAGSLTLELTDLDSISFALEPAEADAAARALGAGTAWLHVLVLPDADTLVGSACFSYPKSEAYRVHGLLLEAALVRTSGGAPLARARTPLYASWEAELGRHTRPAPGPRVAAARIRVVEGTVSGPDLALFGDALAARLLPCWRTALEAAPGHAGALVVTLTVDKRGRLRDAKVSIDMLHTPAVTACVLTELAAATLPRPATKEAVVVVPVHFEP